MSAIECNLDLSRLEKVRHTAGKVTARCPACAEEGRDRRGDHLVILPSGKFACAAMPGDTEHRRRIFALVGIAGEHRRDPEEDRRWKERRAKEHTENRSRNDLVAAARAKRHAIIARYGWELADVWEDSPQRIDCSLVESDSRHFLASLFPAEALLWTGEVFESGDAHADRWRPARTWQSCSPGERLGPMVTPAVWRPGTVSRSASQVAAAPFTVLDFDGLDGVKPETPSALRAHLLASLALVRWLREGLHWQLAAIVWTGGKSLHAWFHTPPPVALESLSITAAALGVDAGLVGRPEHPCRLPGQRHAGTGERSRVLWLHQSPPLP